jgi:DNA-binding response OmpR family regulator
MRILLIEDNRSLAEAVKFMLERQGWTVEAAYDGETGLDLALMGGFDVLVLDIMLPKVDGLEILRRMRAKQLDLPVIILSAMSETMDKVVGLEHGADDYLAKPFKTAELIARVKALARRKSKPLKTKSVKFADLVYDADNLKLNETKVTKTEGLILDILLGRPNETVQKEFILGRVWGDDSMSNYVEVYISYLRQKLRKMGARTVIQTVRGVGYKITEA